MHTRSSAQVELVERLTNGLRTAITVLDQQVEMEPVYAFGIVAVSGYLPGVGVVANTVGHAERQYADLAESDTEDERDYFFVNVEEWEYFDWESMEGARALLDELADLFYDEGEIFDDIDDIAPFFVEAAIEALRRVDPRSALGRTVDPLLTGLFIADPSLSAIDDMIAVSATVNDPVWHDRFARSYMRLKGQG